MYEVPRTWGGPQNVQEGPQCKDLYCLIAFVFRYIFPSPRWVKNTSALLNYQWHADTILGRQILVTESIGGCGEGKASYSQKIHPNRYSMDLYVGKCTGFSYPHGSRVRVPVGTGTGNDSPTRDLQNESKNMFFGGELNEIQPIS